MKKTSVIQVEIRSECPKCRISISKLKQTVEAIFKKIKVSRAQVGVLLVSDSRIRKINKRYLNHDRVTDVIAFSYEISDLDPKVRCYRSSKAADGKCLLGDVVISLETAKRRAKEYGNTFFYEVSYYLCHGILHLMGMDDRTQFQREMMLAKQDEILESIFNL